MGDRSVSELPGPGPVPVELVVPSDLSLKKVDMSLLLLTPSLGTGITVVGSSRRICFQ